MDAKLAILPGDGIGVEVTAQAVRVLESVARLYGHTFELVEAPIGVYAAENFGSALPEQTLALCLEADATLLGAVGGPSSRPIPPERGLLELRLALEVFANLRPFVPLVGAEGGSPLRPELLRGVDLMIVRELTGGLYFGKREQHPDHAYDTCVYHVDEIVRVTRTACELARARRGKLASVDKSNVLATSRLWRETVSRVVAEEYPDVVLEHLLVDAAAMHLLRRSDSFDVILTSNMFGDILADEAALLCGSLGLCPSASLGTGTRGLYEPVHGCAPDIAGQGVANPAGAMLSVAMLLRHSLALVSEALAVEAAVAATIEAGIVTADLAGPEARAADTATFGDAVVERFAALAPSPG